ncbi:unnamed protein product, partial [Rotaria sp. Silwood1]
NYIVLLKDMDSSLTPSTNVINCHSSSVFNRQTLYTFSLIDYVSYFDIYHNNEN